MAEVSVKLTRPRGYVEGKNVVEQGPGEVVKVSEEKAAKMFARGSAVPADSTSKRIAEAVAPQKETEK